MIPLSCITKPSSYGAKGSFKGKGPAKYRTSLSSLIYIGKRLEKFQLKFQIRVQFTPCVLNYLFLE